MSVGFKKVKMLVSVFIGIALLFMNGCGNYHELDEHERQVYGAVAEAYFKDYSSVFYGYVTEESMDILEASRPSYELFEDVYKANDLYYGMYEGCTLKLRNGANFYASLGVIQDGNLGTHELMYLSEEISCVENTIDATIAQMKAHTPKFMDYPWINAVFDEFYADDVDICAEWMKWYAEAVQELDNKGFSEKLYSSYNYRKEKTILETENGNYEFQFWINYRADHAYWTYSYEIALDPIKEK